MQRESNGIGREEVRRLRRARRATAAVTCALLAGACASVESAASAPTAVVTAAVVGAQKEAEQEPEVFRPVPETTEVDDWIRLTSGEWLRGELSSLDRDRIEFDSEELDELTLDWEDVVEVVTEAPFTLLLPDRSTIVGVPRFEGDAVVVRTAEGERRYSRDQIEGFVRGRPTERNYWSGRVKLGGSVRSGNTDQFDSMLAVKATRRTAASRLSLSLDSVAGSVEGTETVNNQTMRGSIDYFVSPRVYARPLGFELFRDRIQNIDLRATPYTAVGYILLDEADVEWEVDAGLGYRYTRYVSVEEGEDDTSGEMTGILGTAYTNELTPDVDLTFVYYAQIGLEDTEDTNQATAFGLTFELPWDLDFDFRVVWKRVGMPAADEDGEIPDEDDLRVDVGVSWEF